MDNEWQKKYVHFRQEFYQSDRSEESILALYNFLEELENQEDTAAKQVLVDVYALLMLKQSAYELMASIVDESDRKALKKLMVLERAAKTHGNSFPVPKPKSKAEKEEMQEKLNALPRFRYHPNPLDTEVFREGPSIICDCCGKKAEIYYEKGMYARDEVGDLCPWCIANGKAAEKFKGSFVQDAEMDKVKDKEKITELFERTPGYYSWQGENWLACCNDFCAFLGDIGTKELEQMGIADEVFAEYDASENFSNIREHLVKKGAAAGYLFQCLHCGKYRIGVDLD